MTKPIRLGSGKLYIVDFTDAIPTNETIETEENLLGLIKGGATLTYTPSYYEAKDDLGLAEKEIITAEEATLKSGILTWNGKTLEKLSATARVEEANNKRTVKIGGISKMDQKRYLLRFVYTDKKDGDVRLTICGANRAGFDLNFMPDKETVVDAEFKAKPLDEEGTLVIFEEDLPTSESEGSK